MTLSPSVCCGFTSSFNKLSGISLFFPTWKSTNFLGLFVLMLGGGQFCFFSANLSVFFPHCFCSSTEHTVVLAPVHVSFFCYYVVFTVFLCHRIIDVSPRAFKKHSQVFEAMKSSEDGTYKVTEHFAVWSMLEKQTAANEWESQMPLDWALLKHVAVLEERCTKSKKYKCKIRHFDLVLCYISPSHMISLWAQAWSRLMNHMSSEMEATVPRDSKQLSL